MSDAHRPFRPDWRVPPGEHLKEFLLDRGWNARLACEKLGWRLGTLVRVLGAEQAITEELAADLARVFENSPTFWLNLQRHYEEPLDPPTP